METYTKKVLEHFKNPHNYGKMKNPDGVGKVGNVACGDVMWLYIKIGKKKIKNKEQEIIKDIKFETYGCTAAIASSSMITDIAKRKTLDQAINISKDDVVKSLEGLPPIKIHCSVLATDALAEAIYDYMKKNNKKIPEKLEKIHKRIEQEKRIVEEKYKDWVKTEEEMHEKE